MKTFLSKARSVAAATVAILFGCVLAGLGLTAMIYLALFALAVVGLSLLAAPFVALAQKHRGDGFDPMPGESSTAI